MDVALRNPATGQTKFQKIGWSWNCFFFSDLLGIPLFLRGLHGWGAFMVVLWIVNVLASDLPVEQEYLVPAVLLLLNSGFATFFGANANRLAGLRYLATGWEFARPNAAETTTARRHWGLSPAPYLDEPEDDGAGS